MSGDKNLQFSVLLDYYADMLTDKQKDVIDLYYNDKEAWKKLVTRAMKCDFSWSRSADLYIQMYKEAMS